jgi:hypothetical protein
MRTKAEPDRWLTSSEVEKELRIDGCRLMHLRVEGHLGFKKQGNAFLYAKVDVDRLKAELPKAGSGAGGRCVIR